VLLHAWSLNCLSLPPSFHYSRKKGPEFVTEFYKVLPRALRHFRTKADAAGKARVDKVIKVWEERRVFGSSGKSLRQIMDEAEAPAVASSPAQKSAKAPYVPQTIAYPPAAPAPAVPAEMVAAVSAVSDAQQAQTQAAQLGASIAVIQHTLGSAGPDQLAAARSLLGSYAASLQNVIRLREVARQHLQEVANAQATDAANATAALNACNEQLADLDGVGVAPGPGAGSSHGAGNGAAGALPFGSEVQVFDPEKEAADIASKVMDDPNALLEVLSAFSSGASGAGPAGASQVEEYDPEEV